MAAHTTVNMLWKMHMLGNNNGNSGPEGEVQSIPKRKVDD